VPTAWVACKVYGRTSTAPRDQRFPAARFWQDGALPIGPDYESVVFGADVIAGWRQRKAEMLASARRLLTDRDSRWRYDYIGADCNPRRGSVALLEAVAFGRREMVRLGNAIRLAEAA